MENIERYSKEKLVKYPVGHCICGTFIPTGIFQIDWKFYRLCFFNYKQIILE